MPKLSQLEQLNVIIQNAAKGDPKRSSRQIAEDLCLSHRDLIEPRLWEWAVDHIANQVRHLRAKTQRMKDRQLVFEYALGFMHIPRKVELAPGETIPVGDSTRDQFRKLPEQVRRKRIRTVAPVIEEIKRGDALFALYSKKSKHITWAQVIEKEAKKAIQQGLFDEPEFD